MIAEQVLFAAPPLPPDIEPDMRVGFILSAALHAHALRRIRRLPAPRGRRGRLQPANLLPLEDRRADDGPRDGELWR